VVAVVPEHQFTVVLGGVDDRPAVIEDGGVEDLEDPFPGPEALDQGGRVLLLLVRGPVGHGSQEWIAILLEQPQGVLRSVLGRSVLDGIGGPSAAEYGAVVHPALEALDMRGIIAVRQVVRVRSRAQAGVQGER